MSTANTEHREAVSYWWTNQAQTYSREVAGGYLWSPKRKANGERCPSYEFMLDVAPGDIIFSYHNTCIAAIGVARSYCYESPIPQVSNTGTCWGVSGWCVDVNFSELVNQIRPKYYIGDLRDFLEEKYAPLRPNGVGSQGIYLTKVSSAFAAMLSRLIGDEAKHLTDVNLTSVLERRVPNVLAVPASAQILSLVRADPEQLLQLGPEDLETLVCERLEKMGFACCRIGSAQQADGGIDIVICPKEAVQFPYLLAVQVKSHRHGRCTSVDAIRDFAGAIRSQPVRGGVLVTNTTFSMDARWFAEKQQHLIHLRDFNDLSRWIRDEFTAREFWREIPQSLELRPGVTVQVHDVFRGRAGLPKKHR